ncbi:RebB family R body protein, partial [Photobacterium lipolyticum]
MSEQTSLDGDWHEVIEKTEKLSTSVYSEQQTGLIDSMFAETLGLAMQNAITTQLNAQMTTAASVTSACARMLSAPVPPFAGEEGEKGKRGG